MQFFVFPQYRLYILSERLVCLGRSQRSKFCVCACMHTVAFKQSLMVQS